MKQTKEIALDSLVFADDVTVIAEDIPNEQKQFEIM